MQNKTVVDVDEQQRRIREQTRKKEEKIRQALEQKKQKEMDECSFAPKINRKKRQSTNPHQKSMIDVHGSAVSEQQYYDEEEQPRDAEKFYADQNRFLEQKRAKEEFLKAQKLEEEKMMKEKAPKINKKSMQIL